MPSTLLIITFILASEMLIGSAHSLALFNALVPSSAAVFNSLFAAETLLKLDAPLVFSVLVPSNAHNDLITFATEICSTRPGDLNSYCDDAIGFTDIPIHRCL